MQKWIRKQKRKAIKTKNRIVDFLSLLFKIGISAVILFIVIICFMLVRSEETVVEEATDLLEAGTAPHEVSFIESITPYAKEVEETHGVFPSLLIAQAALESDWGRSRLSVESNNYFGIKAANDGAQYTTREFDNDEWLSIKASFKQYDSMRDSVISYADLLKYGTSWDEDLYHGVISADSYVEAAQAIQDAGYATDPHYANKLINIIEQHQLYELDEE
jgi:flagellum-specific peptidoglycan hydrolase FlgJ